MNLYPDVLDSARAASIFLYEMMKGREPNLMLAVLTSNQANFSFGPQSKKSTRHLYASSFIKLQPHAWLRKLAISCSLSRSLCDSYLLPIFSPLHDSSDLLG